MPIRPAVVIPDDAPGPGGERIDFPVEGGHALRKLTPFFFGHGIANRVRIRSGDPPNRVDASLALMPSTMAL